MKMREWDFYVWFYDLRLAFILYDTRGWQSVKRQESRFVFFKYPWNKRWRVTRKVNDFYLQVICICVLALIWLYGSLSVKYQETFDRKWYDLFMHGLHDR